MNVITSLEEARREVESFDGEPEDFVLVISDELQDTVGLNMTIIYDSVLAKGWEIAGFDQGQGFRIYRFKALG